MQIATYSRHDCQPPRSTTVEELPQLLASPESLVWVDMVGPTAEDLRVMRDVFHFHPLAVEDTQNQRQRPKVEEYPGYLFSILNPVAVEADEVIFHELDMFVGKNYLVTVHRTAEQTVTEAHRRIDEACTVIAMSPGYLLYTLVDVVVDSYFPILDNIGDEIDTIGDNVLDNPTRQAMGRLFELKRTLSEMWRVAGQQRDMFSILTREKSEFISDDSLRYYLRDVYDHLLRISDTVSTFRDTLNNVIDLYLSSVSNRLNQQVNRLTIITIGIGVLTVISGFYGMNFERTWPPFEAPWGVPFVMMLMLVTLSIVLVVLRAMRRG